MRILYVAMASSIHVARFLNQVNHLGWDLHLFNSSDFWDPPHALLRNVTLHGCRSWPTPKAVDASVTSKGYWPLPVGGHAVKFVVNRFLPTWTNPARKLAKLIKALKPDIIHGHEIQHAGYLTAEARKFLASKLPPWIVTNWGTDIYYFGRLKRHQPRIREVLAHCDYYSCETERDVQLGRDFGFTGTVLTPVMPNPGGFRFEEIDGLRTPGPTSARRLILMKGYQGTLGRALTGLVALERCKDLLKGYKVLVYSARPQEVVDAVEMLANSTGLDVEVLPQTDDYDAMLRLRGQARVSIGLSISDAASISFLESLPMGCFPIQSDRGGTHEWIRDGEGGLIVHPEDPCSVAAALARALTDDDLVDRAAEINYQTARARMDFYQLREKVIGWYQMIMARGK